MSKKNNKPTDAKPEFDPLAKVLFNGEEVGEAESIEVIPAEKETGGVQLDEPIGVAIAEATLLATGEITTEVNLHPTAEEVAAVEKEKRPYTMDSRQATQIECPICQQPSETYSNHGRKRYQRCTSCRHTFTWTQPKK